MTRFSQTVKDVQDPGSADAAAKSVARATELAIDLEADALQSFRARLCYVQLGTDEEIFLFDTLAEGVKADALTGLFEDPARTKFFHAAGGDLQYLAEHGVRVKSLFDTHRAATLLGRQKVGLADLVREVAGVELKKEHQQANFARRPLPPELREYIAEDVRYLCEVGRFIREECRKADILEEVQLDCDRMVEEAEGRPEIAPFRLKLAKTGLTAQQIALAHAVGQAMHTLRLKWAEEADTPMGMVLSNATISELARLAPQDVKSLSKVPGIRGNILRRHGEEIVKTIADLAQKAAKGELPPPAVDEGSRDPKRSKREDALKVFRTEKAAARKVTGSVVLPNPLVTELAATPPKTVEDLAKVRFFGEKRLRLYGAALVELLRPLS